MSSTRIPAMSSTRIPAMTEEVGRIDRGDGVELAYRRLRGSGPGVVFLGGFNSDMTGSKAEDLAAFCAARNTPYLRLDYSGHGASGGRFQDGTIGRWADDAALLFDRLTSGPQVVIGSSMGGWIMLLLARRFPQRLHGLIGIAPAPDFTERLMWPKLPADVRETILREGLWLRPSAYGDPYPITRALIEDGRKHLVLDAPIALPVPLRLLHGQADPDVPWQHSLLLAESVAGGDVQVTLVKDGDHRLSRPEDLLLLRRTVAALLDDGA